MAKRMKIVTAGRLVYGVCYTMALPSDGAAARGEKRRISSAARKAMNLKQSWQKLELTIAANFGPKDLHVVLTYDDAHLPPSRERARQLLRKWIKMLRAWRKARGLPTRYIYVTEQYTDEGERLHHHVVINGTGDDYGIIRELWPYGSNIDIERLDNWDGYEALARYLTKEPAEHGKPHVGDRVWTPSLGLAQPVTESCYVPDNVTLTAPPGARILENYKDPKENQYGTFQYIKYLLPEKDAGPAKRGRWKPDKGGSPPYIFQAGGSV